MVKRTSRLRNHAVNSRMQVFPVLENLCELQLDFDGNQLIKALTSQLGRVFSRDQLMNEMYSDYRIVSDRAVDTHIKNLRKKLSNAGVGKDLVESV